MANKEERKKLQTLADGGSPHAKALLQKYRLPRIACLKLLAENGMPGAKEKLKHERRINKRANKRADNKRRKQVDASRVAVFPGATRSSETEARDEDHDEEDEEEIRRPMRRRNMTGATVGQHEAEAAPLGMPLDDESIAAPYQAPEAVMIPQVAGAEAVINHDTDREIQPRTPSPATTTLTEAPTRHSRNEEHLTAPSAGSTTASTATEMAQRDIVDLTTDNDDNIDAKMHPEALWQAHFGWGLPTPAATSLSTDASHGRIRSEQEMNLELAAEEAKFKILDLRL
jgi:hypothetical protein